MLLVFAVARISSINEFGVFALTFAILTTVMATCRGLFGTPLALLSEERSRLDVESRYALVAAGIAGFVAVPLLLLVSERMGGLQLGLPVAAACPIVLAQDTTRFIASSQGQPLLAVVSDGWWTVGSATLFGLCQARTIERPSDLIWCWTAAALLALVIGGLATRTRPRFAGILRWARPGLRARLRFGGEALIGATSGLIVLASAAVFIGKSASAALRGASSTLGPIAVVMSTIPIAVVPDVRLRGLRSSAEIWHYMRRIAIPLAATSLAIGAVSILVPHSVGFTFLGPSWSVIQPLLPITSLEYAFLAWLNALNGAMRAQGRSVELLQVRFCFAGASLLLGCGAGIAFGSAPAVAWALVLAAASATAFSRSRLFHHA